MEPGPMDWTTDQINGEFSRSDRPPAGPPTEPSGWEGARDDPGVRAPASVEYGQETGATPPRRPAKMPRQPFQTVGIVDGLFTLAGWILPWRRRTPGHERAGLDAGLESDPVRRRFARTLFARRCAYFGFVALTTAGALFGYWTVLRVDGLNVLEVSLLGLFAILFGWIAVSFWLVCAGAYARWRKAPLDTLRRPTTESRPVGTPPRGRRTALVVPVYNEEADRLFAGLETMCRSLEQAGGDGLFDVYVLSDSTDPRRIRQEEVRWRALRAATAGTPRLFYRRRCRNKGRKCGNIADFCRRWGALYDYMIVLDADSLMAGDTMLEMVGLMDANPNAGLIQVPPAVVGRSSLFARIQQFASAVYGPLYATGLAFLQGPDGNYWGHNAIIRMKPFMKHCGLPTLPGKPPLGGEIMSHDFVEAALLRRAGWDIWLMPELGGSFEEPPPTIADHLIRDRRWCQGNLQHARLIPLRGLRAASRVHLALGVMSYLSSPLWLIFLCLSLVVAHQMAQTVPVSFEGTYPVLSLPISHLEQFVRLILCAAGLLYGPKILAFLDLVRSKERRRAHGGGAAVGMSVLLESLFSTVLAPVTMLSHSWFVVNNLLGRSVGWGGQQREDRCLPISAIVRSFLPHTAVGIAAGALVMWLTPESMIWLSPLLFGLVVAIPLVYVTCGRAAGEGARNLGLFLIPCETNGRHIVGCVHDVMMRGGAGDALAVANRRADRSNQATNDRFPWVSATREDCR